MNPSNLSSDAFDHFAKREEELRRMNESLDAKRDAVTRMMDDALRPPVRTEAAAPSAPVMGVTTVGAEQNNDAAAVRHQATVDGLQATIRLQKSRILTLQDELDASLKESEEKDRVVAELKQGLKQRDEAIHRLEKVNKELQVVTERQSKRSADGMNRAESVSRELTEARAELDLLRVEQKKLTSQLASKDVRLTRALEETEKLRVQLSETRAVTQVMTKSTSGDVDVAVAECKRLEKQRNELMTAFKKQAKLIDVLRRQKAHLEAARYLQFTEEEFVRAMESAEKLHLA